jgi:serine/threonine-protein kinase
MHDDARDAELAAIVDAALVLPAGQRPSLETLVAVNPQFADELRQLWGAVMVVDAVAEHVDRTSRGANPATIDANSVPAGHSFNPPRQLGDFELHEEIGRGGMGAVYRARQGSLDRIVAVKVMLHGATASPEDRARFRSEAEAAARLDHPNIVPVYGAGEIDGWRFIAMKLIDGRTLAHRLAAGPLPEREAAHIVLTAARAIHYAHERGVVHRDLKPANILLDSAGGAHVSDFGLARDETRAQTLTAAGAILGTPLYMAPEQAAAGRRQITPACDVFSLGAILYALLTGQAPFQGDNPVSTLLRLTEQDPAPPRQLNPRVSRDMEMIVLRALQKPPELRYASAAALADDLSALLAGEPIAARSGRFSQVFARMFGDTLHAAVLENWGLLWMWHAAVLLVLCLVTNLLYVRRNQWPVFQAHWPYLLLWGGGLAVWAPAFWALRRRSGPVTAVERQIAHAWGASIVAVMLLFGVEAILNLDVLTLSPVLGLIGGMIFVVKAGILTGAFYLNAAAMFACSVVMALMHRAGNPYGITLFGFASAAAFFLPGWKYFRQSRRDLE